MYFSKKTTFLAAFSLILLLSCSDDSDSEPPPLSKSSSSSKEEKKQKYSSSETEVSSSSSDGQSSSSVEAIQSSSSEPSSSSVELSSSSSVALSSSSSVALSSSSGALCGNTGMIPTAAEFCYDNSTIKNLCNGKTYNTQQFCGDDNEVHTLCSGSPYSLKTQFCLPDGPADKCNGIEYNSGQFCFNNKIETKCGGAKYLVTEACCDGKIYTLSETKRCESNIVETKCGNGWYDASNIDTQRCTNNAVEKKCGILWYNIEKQFCFSSNNGNKIIGDFCGTNTRTYDPGTYGCKNGYNGIYLKSTIGSTYEYVLIGSQIWMAQNLKFQVPSYAGRCYGGTDGSYYDDDCNAYGMLYDWATAMGVATKYNLEELGVSDVKHQGICPDGWHIPSNADWRTLMEFVNPDCSNSSSCPYAGTKLKAKNGWFSTSGVPEEGTDDYGFSALPGGSRLPPWYWTNTFVGRGEPEGDYSGCWWSASEKAGDDAYYFCIVNDSETVYLGSGDYIDKTTGRSVRCLKDN